MFCLPLQLAILPGFRNNHIRKGNLACTYDTYDGSGHETRKWETDKTTRIKILCECVCVLSTSRRRPSSGTPIIRADALLSGEKLALWSQTATRAHCIVWDVWANYTAADTAAAVLGTGMQQGSGLCTFAVHNPHYCCCCTIYQCREIPALRL